MDYHLTADEERRSPHHQLKPGEWQLWCRKCDFKVEKNAAAHPICPNCGDRFAIAKGLQQPFSPRAAELFAILDQSPGRFANYAWNNSHVVDAEWLHGNRRARLPPRSMT